jgi:hypothetical protein
VQCVPNVKEDESNKSVSVFAKNVIPLSPRRIDFPREIHALALVDDSTQRRGGTEEGFAGTRVIAGSQQYGEAPHRGDRVSGWGLSRAAATGSAPCGQRLALCLFQLDNQRRHSRVESLREVMKHGDRGIAPAPFQEADVGPVQPGLVGERFLGQACRLASAVYNRPESLCKAAHTVHWTVEPAFQPQTIVAATIVWDDVFAYTRR